MRREIDWKNLGFKYMQTDWHVRHVWRDGAWGEGELLSEPYMRLHIAATGLHYGQSAFEGLKAFRCRDGGVRLFRPEMNARRLARTAERVCMVEVPEEIFLDAVQKAVQANLDYLPPYGTGGAMYVRPLLFGSGPTIGVNPSPEFTFLVLVVPVGPYYVGGLQPVRALVLDDYDRTAPRGTGNVKVAGNYAAGMKPHLVAMQQGFRIELYLDAKDHHFVDEFGTSNFIAITKDGRYVTPASPSILPSVTNSSLQEIAKEMGLSVEVRPVAWDELADFAEIGACGTAVVITPVNEIVRGDQVLRIGPQEGCGPVLQELYERVTAIQYGEAPDRFGWTRLVATEE